MFFYELGCYGALHSNNYADKICRLGVLSKFLWGHKPGHKDNY